MPNDNLTDNEKKMIQEAFERDKAIQQETKHSHNFKFEIGQDVYHTAFGYNAKVMRRIYTEDADSYYNSYDIGIWESNPPIEGQNVAEIHLKAGHRTEGV